MKIEYITPGLCYVSVDEVLVACVTDTANCFIVEHCDGSREWHTSYDVTVAALKERYAREQGDTTNGNS